MKAKKLMAAMLVLLVLALVGAGCGAPATEAPEATAEPIAEATEEAVPEEGVLDLGGREIRAATTGDCPPWNMVDENGNPDGFEPDLLAEICKLANCTVNWSITNFDGLIPGVRAGDFDAAVSDIFITEERDKVVDFTEPYFRSGEVVVVRADEERIKSYEDLATLDVLVGSETGTSCEEAAREVAKVPDDRLQLYEGLDTLFLALMNGDIDAVVDGSISAKRYVEKYTPQLKIVGEGEDAMFGGGSSAIAIQEGDEDLKEIFGKAIQILKENGTVDNLLVEWGVLEEVPETSESTLPDLGGRVLRAATTGDCKPWNMVDEGGTVTGMEVELLEQICELANCELDWHLTNFDGLIPGLIAGDFDIVVSNMTATSKRDEVIDFTTPYYRSGEVVTVRADDDRIQSYKDLAGLDVLVGSETGTICEEAAREIAKVPDDRLQLYEGLDTLFLALVNGDIDAVVDGYMSTANYVELHDPKLEIVGRGTDDFIFGGGPAAMGIQEGDDELNEAISAAIEYLRDNGILDSVLEKYEIPPLEQYPD